MVSIGLFWIVSWFGSFSLAESLPLSYQTDTSTVKISLSSVKLRNHSHLLFVPREHQAKLFSAITLPKFLNIDWGTKQPKLSTSESYVTSSPVKKTAQTRFCSAVKEISTSQDFSQKPKVLTAEKLIKPNSEKKEFTPNIIWRSLQNFFKLTDFMQQISPANSVSVSLVHRGINKYEVSVNNRLIARLADKQQAILIKERLTRLLKVSNLDASSLKPAFVDGVPALILGNRLIFAIEENVSQKLKRSGDLLAIEWTNNLRLALKATPLPLVEAQAKMYGLTPSNQKMSGLASWYGPYFHGRLTANGETFNQNELTVAHKSLPFNTYLQVSNVKTQKSIIVRVNDRGPYIPPRSLDLSLVAARCIGAEVAGVIPYKAVIMHKSSPVLTVNPNLSEENQQSNRKLARISDL